MSCLLGSETRPINKNGSHGRVRWTFRLQDWVAIWRFYETSGLDAHTAHADELADPLPQELTPLERLKGSVKRYDRPTDSVWDEYFDSDGVSDDLMEDREQPAPDERDK